MIPVFPLVPWYVLPLFVNTQDHQFFPFFSWLFSKSSRHLEDLRAVLHGGENTPQKTPLNNLDWVSSQLNVSASFLQNFPPYFLQLPTFFDISHKCIRANCTKVTKLVNTRKIWENSLKTSVGGITCILDLLSWVDRARLVNKDKRLS